MNYFPSSLTYLEMNIYYEINIHNLPQKINKIIISDIMIKKNKNNLGKKFIIKHKNDNTIDFTKNKYDHGPLCYDKSYDKIHNYHLRYNVCYGECHCYKEYDPYLYDYDY